ncbi:13677_t:CDS:2, partial [Cetraspora pellucida]
ILEEQPNIFTNKEVFEIAFNENDTTLADCFIGIVQIAIALKKIPTSNNLCTLAIAFCDICELAISYYKDMHHSEKECRELGVVEDEYNHLQELAKTMFAILQVPRLKSMAQIYSFYVSNFKKELKFYDNNCVEMELYNSVLNETIFAKMNNVELNNENKDELEIVNLMANDITIVLQDLVDLLDP